VDGATKHVTNLIKVLHVIDGLNVGGKERRMVELLKGLLRQQAYAAEVVILSADIHFKEILDLPICTHQLVRRFKKDPSIIFRLLRVARRFAPNVIHAWDSMSALYVIPVARFVRARFVNGMITDADPNVKPFTKPYVRSKLTFPFSDLIIANSHAGLIAYDAPPDKSHVIHNGFDDSRLAQVKEPTVVRRQLGITTPYVVGMVASFSKWKDYHTYFLVVRRILDLRRDITFIAIGDGANLEVSRTLVRPEHTQWVRFLGKQQDVESIVNIFDIGVLATFTEGISNSIMEYMALVKPVVATDGGGTNELVANGLTGFLVPPRNVDAMADRILELLNNPTLATSMGREGRQRLTRDFNIEGMLQGFIRAYTVSAEV
jgi:glycosyltransferase involved in cell wall biosynthesis